MPDTWIPSDSYKTIISDSRLAHITESQLDILIEAEAYAKGLIKDVLGSRYDIPAVFAGQPADYPVVRIWVQHIVLYLIWQRVPDKLIPERVIKNYDDTIYRIGKIEDGKASTTLPILQVPAADGSDTTTPKSKFRWGGNARRSH